MRGVPPERRARTPCQSISLPISRNSQLITQQALNKHIVKCQCVSWSTNKPVTQPASHPLASQVKVNSGSASRRGPQTLQDLHDYTLAALSPWGVVFASDLVSSKRSAVVTFRPLDSGDKSAEWTKPLPPNSDPLGVAVGQ